MSEPRFRVAVFINQFFAGLGGEQAADVAPRRLDGAVGSARAISAALGEEATVVATVVCGDNYPAMRGQAAIDEIVDLVAQVHPDALVAGPAFGSGRYGVNCCDVCQAVTTRLEVPAVAGLHSDNPAVSLFRRTVLIVPTADSAAGMGEAAVSLARLAVKLARGDTLGPAAVEGYLPRGFRRNVFAAETGAARAVNLALAKLKGEPFQSEIVVPRFERIPAPPGLPALSATTLGVVTESGIVPRGNPDRIEAGRATHWEDYSLDLIDESGARVECVHGGFDNRYVNENPYRVVPLDALRGLCSAGRIGGLTERYYVTVGNNTSIENSARFGREIAADLARQDISAALITAT